MKSLTYLVYAKYIHFCNLFLIICSFLVLSFLFNLTTLKPITYSETIMLCVLGRFSHSHKFIMKLDNKIAYSIYYRTKLYMCMCSVKLLFATPWTAAHQAPLSMAFSRQEYWNALPSPSPGELPPNQGSNLHLFLPLALTDRFFTTLPP